MRVITSGCIARLSLFVFFVLDWGERTWNGRSFQLVGGRRWQRSKTKIFFLNFLFIYLIFLFCFAFPAVVFVSANGYSHSLWLFLCVVICQLWRATTTHTDIHVYTHKTHWRLEPQRRTDNKMTPSSTPVNFSSDAKPRRPVLIVSYRLSLSLPHLTSFSLSLFVASFFLLGFFFFILMASCRASLLMFL